MRRSERQRQGLRLNVNARVNRAHVARDFINRIRIGIRQVPRDRARVPGRRMKLRGPAEGNRDGCRSARRLRERPHRSRMPHVLRLAAGRRKYQRSAAEGYPLNG
jgi:hypothetical protein